MAKHEFGIIENFKNNKWYYETYNPNKNNYVSVNDDLMDEVLLKYNEDFRGLDTYFQISTQKGKGLDYAGITLIPPSSLEKFKAIIIKANKEYKSEELQNLIGRVNEAIYKSKYLIHFGL